MVLHRLTPPHFRGKYDFAALHLFYLHYVMIFLPLLLTVVIIGIYFLIILRFRLLDKTRYGGITLGSHSISQQMISQ